jgi:hypothetical protein
MPMNMPRKPRLRRYWTVLCAKQPIRHVRSQLSRAWCLTFHRWHGSHRYASLYNTDARYVLGLDHTGRQRLGAGSSSSSAAQRCLTALQLTRLIVSCRSVNRRPAHHAVYTNNVPADGTGEHLTAHRLSMSFDATRGRARHGTAAASSAHACEHSGRRTATRTHARASKAYATREQSHSHFGRPWLAARPCRRSDHAASHSHPCVACAHVRRCRCRWRA